MVEVHVVGVERCHLESAVDGHVPLPYLGRHGVAGVLEGERALAVGHCDHAVAVGGCELLVVVTVGLVGLAEVGDDAPVGSGGVGHGGPVLTSDDLDGVALLVVEEEGDAVARAVLVELVGHAHAGVVESLELVGQRALGVDERPPESAHLLGQRVGVCGVVVLGARCEAQQHRQGEHQQKSDLFSHCC